MQYQVMLHRQQRLAPTVAKKLADCRQRWSMDLRGQYPRGNDSEVDCV